MKCSCRCFPPPDGSCARRGRRRPSERRRWGWSWRPWASGWRRRRRDVLSFYRRCHDSLPKTQRLDDLLRPKWITNLAALSQVNLLQRSLLKQSEEQRRAAALEQQVILDSDWFQSGDMSPPLRTKDFLALAPPPRFCCPPRTLRMRSWTVRICSTSYRKCWRSCARPGIRFLNWSLL